MGLLEVTGDRYRDESPIWGEEVFPVRFPVRPLILLKPENGVPMEQFAGKLSFFAHGDTARKWSGYVRNSPTKYGKADGDAIAAAIRNADANPVARPVDPKQLRRPANLYRVKGDTSSGGKPSVVRVPTEEEEEEAATAEVIPGAPTHTEIQWRLLSLGSRMGLRVWAPRADRGKDWNGHTLGSVPNLLGEIPTQFDEVTNTTIENIDVLWLRDNAFVAAFEVEHTTSIYSGLLRMSDLLTMQPNIDIKLYLVGPDERYSKFTREVPRATFARRNKPLHTVCGFIPYSKLCQHLQEAEHFIPHLKPDFIDEIADYYDPEQEYEVQ